MCHKVLAKIRQKLRNSALVKNSLSHKEMTGIQVHFFLARIQDPNPDRHEN